MSTKKCARCDISKSITEYGKNSRELDKIHRICKQCINEESKARYAANPDLRRNRDYLSRYKISLEEYNNLFINQRGSCKICNNKCNTQRKLSVDHCHITGEVRGLLCHNCNTGLGQFKDDINNLNKAIEYLNEFSK